MMHAVRTNYGRFASDDGFTIAADTGCAREYCYADIADHEGAGLLCPGFSDPMTYIEPCSDCGGVGALFYGPGQYRTRFTCDTCNGRGTR